MRIHFIIHEVFEAPSVYLNWAILRGHQTSQTKVYLEEHLPLSDREIDVLIVMGGPQSTIEDMVTYPYYHPKDEIALIQQFIIAGKPVIGVCLGAQLLGEAFGAKVETSPEIEIGNFPIELTQSGLADKTVSHLGHSLTVGHWHGDMPGLTAQSQVLATSQGCPRQIIKYSDKHYGFQCHLEFSKSLVKLLLAEEVNHAQAVATHDFVQNSKAIYDYDYSEMNAKLEEFLDAFII